MQNKFSHKYILLMFFYQWFIANSGKDLKKFEVQWDAWSVLQS